MKNVNFDPLKFILDVLTRHSEFKAISVDDLLYALDKQGFTFKDGTVVYESEEERLDSIARAVHNERVRKPDGGQQEHKFKKGDWIVGPSTCNQLFNVLEVCEDSYKVGEKECILFENEKFYRHWHLGDAKAGDVLACPNDAGDRDVVFVFKNINSDEGCVFCFCASDANGCFCTNNDYVRNSNSTNISPATKEQRKLLFDKMHEAGYAWDEKNKYLINLKEEFGYTLLEISSGRED